MRNGLDRKSTRLNSSHTEIYTLSLHDALPIFFDIFKMDVKSFTPTLLYEDTTGYQVGAISLDEKWIRSEEHTSELQSHRDLHSFPTRRSSDLFRHLQDGCEKFHADPALRGHHRLPGRSDLPR